MKDARFGIGEHIIPLKAPVDSAGTAFATPYVDLKGALHATFFYYAGVVTAASADQPVIITFEAATSAASSAAEVQIPFKYRKSGATGTDTWGAITQGVAATGYSYGTTDDGSMVLFDIDPAGLESLLADARFVRMVVGIDAGGTVTLNSAWCVIDPRYPQLTQQSTS